MAPHSTFARRVVRFIITPLAAAAALLGGGGTASAETDVQTSTEPQTGADTAEEPEETVSPEALLVLGIGVTGATVAVTALAAGWRTQAQTNATKRLIETIQAASKAAAQQARIQTLWPLLLPVKAKIEVEEFTTGKPLKIRLVVTNESNEPVYGARVNAIGIRTLRVVDKNSKPHSVHIDHIEDREVPDLGSFDVEAEGSEVGLWVEFAALGRNPSELSYQRELLDAIIQGAELVATEWWYTSPALGRVKRCEPVSPYVGATAEVEGNAVPALGSIGTRATRLEF